MIGGDDSIIPLNFGLWWSGSKLSYLRYLTFKTLRHFHPHARIDLFIGDKCRLNEHRWGCEKQDFENPNKIGKDYIEDLEDLDVRIVHVDFFGQYAPNYQSDFFRWWYLNQYAGFYLDTDQIILKPFDTLPLNHDFLFSAYKAVTCGIYTPVGVLGASHLSMLVRDVLNNISRYLDINNYNSAGPFMLRNVLGSRQWEEKMFNAPSDWFYPIPESYRVGDIYEGKFKIPEASYSLHWFGGHPMSQAFNKIYTEEFAETSKDTISEFVRKMK